MPNRKQNTTICRTSPRASASTMLVGTALSSVSARPAGASIPAASAVPTARPSPGLVAITLNHPSSSAMVVATSKQTADFQPSRPKAPRDPAPAIARISTPTSTGAMIDRIRRRNRSLTNSMRSAQPGADRPRLRPSAIEIRIHVASENLGMRSTAVRGRSSVSAVARARCRTPQHVTGIRCPRGTRSAPSPKFAIPDVTRLPAVDCPAGPTDRYPFHEQAVPGSMLACRRGSRPPRGIRCGTCPAPGITRLAIRISPRSA